jgi:hypothetical protein
MLLYAKDKQENGMLSTEFHDGKYQKLTKAKVFRKRKCQTRSRNGHFYISTFLVVSCDT